MLQAVILVSIQGQTAGVVRSLYVNSSNSFNALIQTPSECTAASSMNIEWVVTDQKTGEIQEFPTVSNKAQSFTIPPYSLQPGIAYEVSLSVGLMVSNSLSQSACGCAQGLLQVIELGPEFDRC